LSGLTKQQKSQGTSIASLKKAISAEKKSFKKSIGALKKSDAS